MKQQTIPVTLKKGTKIIGATSDASGNLKILECEYRKQRFDIIYYGKKD